MALDESHDWGGSHLGPGINFSVMGTALARLEGAGDEFALMFQLVGDEMQRWVPEQPLEKKLANVQMAVAIVGQRGAGKGTALRFMEEHGVCTAPSSRGLREVSKVILQRDATTPELVEMGQRFKSLWGFDAFTRMVLWQMTSLPPPLWIRIAIDGLRTDEELQSFRQLFGDRSKVVAVVRPSTQSDEEGWRVIVARQADTGKVEYESYADFVATQQKERERIAKLIEQSDAVIINEGSLEGLRTKVHDFLTSSPIETRQP